MFKGKKVIDVHGHISTPPHFRAHAYNLIALRTPGEGDVQIPEAAMKQALDRHLRMLDERRIDVQLISPRPVAMMHWERPFLVEAWTRTTNEVIAQQCRMHPTRFVGVAQLPQTPELNIPTSKIRLLGAALSGLHRDGDLAWMAVNREQMERCGAIDEDCEGLVNYALGIEGVEVAVFFRELADRRWRVSLRSKGAVDVSHVAARFGGGDLDCNVCHHGHRADENYCRSCHKD